MVQSWYHVLILKTLSESSKGMSPAFMFQKFVLKVLGPTPHPCSYGMKFGVQESKVDSSRLILPPSVQCITLVGQKTQNHPK